MPSSAERRTGQTRRHWVSRDSERPPEALITSRREAAMLLAGWVLFLLGGVALFIATTIWTVFGATVVGATGVGACVSPSPSVRRKSTHRSHVMAHTRGTSLARRECACQPELLRR